MKGEKITLSHGSGGSTMHRLIDSVFLKEFDSSSLRAKTDSAIVRIGRKKIAMTTDSYVVDPIFFPGGDIGSLAVNGTVNDLSVCGARPAFISLGLVIEEGLPLDTLGRIAKSVALASRKAGVEVVTGDTKVVERGACDKIFINTSGIGEICYAGLGPDRIREGDAVVISGPVGDHAISVLSSRESMAFGTAVRSDSAPLNGLIRRALKASRGVRVMRDPTRGGLATTLNEFVNGKRLSIALEEDKVPVRPGVRQACEMLGLDHLYLACEGVVVMIVAPESAGRVLRAVRSDPLGRRSAVIGRVTGSPVGKVYVDAPSGTGRALDMLSGEQLPRIC